MIERPANNSKGEVIPGGNVIGDAPQADERITVRQLEILRDSLPSSKKDFVQRAIDNKPKIRRHPIVDFIDDILEGFTPQEF